MLGVFFYGGGGGVINCVEVSSFSLLTRKKRVCLCSVNKKTSFESSFRVRDQRVSTVDRSPFSLGNSKVQRNVSRHKVSGVWRGSR